MAHKLVLLILAFILTDSLAKAQSKDSLDVMKATERFLNAFKSFDWPVFRNSFSKDASIFFPFGKEGKRRSGKTEIEETWVDMFPEFLEKEKKDSLKIDPQNIQLQLYNKTAILSFHLLPKTTMVSRRTVVFIKMKEEWKIVHLHASIWKASE